MQTNNDLKRIETYLLESIIRAHSADYGRLLSNDELLERKKTIAFFEKELKSRKKTDLGVVNAKLTYFTM